MSAHPPAVMTSAQGVGGYARNSWFPLAGRLPPHLSGYLRAVRVHPSRCRALLQFSRRYIDPVCRWIPGLHVVSERSSLGLMKGECRPVVTKILVGPDFTDFNCSVLQIDEWADWLARQETEEEDA